jgi:radical SAM superfamily enzyme YgiQ (UPF0313 family)
MRILLIAPSYVFPDSIPGWLLAPQMSLLILEALSGDKHRVRIVEEELEPVPVDESWDLVGITAMTATAPRAYSLADDFRARGSLVVLGGVHVSVMPEEASLHADAVVVGESEAVWAKVLEDAETGRLERIYRNSSPDEIHVPLVRYGERKKGIFSPNVAPAVASRGCPNACEFCSVPGIYGHRVRRLPVGQVVEQVRRSRSVHFAFLDDNLAANREFAMELFAALKPLGKKWIAQIPVRAILDDEFFHTAAVSGLRGIFSGFETIDEKARRRYTKSVSVGDYARAVRNCRDSGVFLNASFIFGMDEHDISIFDETLDFIMANKVPSISGYILTPYPGTPLFDRISQEGRLLHRNWTYYDHLTPVIRPARMSTGELAEGYVRFRESLFSVKSIVHRFSAQLRVNPYAYLGLNLAYRHTTSVLRQHYKRYFNWLEKNALQS